MNDKLGVAYNAKKGKAGCMDCMAKGGKCMAHGGMVDNEEMHPDHEAEMPSDMMRDEKIEYSKGNVQSDVAKLARGGGVDEPDMRDEGDDDDSDMDMYSVGGQVVQRKVGKPQSDLAKYAEGGVIQKDTRQSKLEEMGAGPHSAGSVVDSIMADRKRRMMADGGLVGPDVETDFEPRVNLEPVRMREDSEHGVENGSEDDQSLVGQILKERKMRRRG